MDEFAEKRKTVKANVIEILERFPSARSDYRKLVHFYWYHIDGLKNFVPMDRLESLTPPESITRACREIQNKRGMLRPTLVAVQARDVEEQQYEEYYAGQKRKKEELW